MAAHPKDAVDTMAPWTIKSVATEDKDFIIASARKEGLTVGQWISRRVKEWREDGSPISRPLSAGVGNPVAAPSIAELTALLDRLPGLWGTPAGEVVASEIRRAVVDGLRANVPPASLGHTPAATENDRIEASSEKPKLIGA